LKRIFSDGIYPTRAELPDIDLLDRFYKEFARVEGKNSRLPDPSPDVVLREVGRK
jgi:hypothetical protein